MPQQVTGRVADRSVCMTVRRAVRLTDQVYDGAVDSGPQI
jgi:hypothetical protein